MNLDQLRNLYDEDQRRNIIYPNMKREATPEVVRLIDLHSSSSFIIYSHLTAEQAESVIPNEIAYFTELGHSFEWKLYSHDTPADLRERLAAHGFEIEEEETIMVLPIAESPATLFDAGTHSIRRITDPDQMEDILFIENTVWEDDYTAMVNELAAEMRAAPDRLLMYVAYVAEQPASCGWMRLAPNSVFGSLWGGSTLPQYRGHGLYRALVAVRAAEAQQRGIKYLNVDASSMSRPILERLGFQTISHSWACVYNLPT